MNKRKQEDSTSNLINKMFKRELAITVRQGDSSFQVTTTQLDKFPDSFVAISHQFPASDDAEDHFFDVQDRVVEYFPLIQKMYEDGAIQLAPNIIKDNFLKEFAFWFPYAEYDNVTYCDDAKELKWLSTVAYRLKLDEWLCAVKPKLKQDAETGKFTTEIAPNMHLISNWTRFTDELAAHDFTAEHKVRGYNNSFYELSWVATNPLVQIAVEYYINQLPTWATLMAEAKLAAAQGKFCLSHDLARGSNLIKHPKTQEVYRRIFPDYMMVKFNAESFTVSWDL